jgi:hypothetical protein
MHLIDGKVKLPDADTRALSAQFEAAAAFEYVASRDRDHYQRVIDKFGYVRVRVWRIHVSVDFLSGAVDVVFDDWSHELLNQRIAFVALFPFMSSGGVYIVAVCMCRRCCCALTHSHASQGLNVGYEEGRAAAPSWVEDTKNMLDTLNRHNFDAKFAVLDMRVDQLVESVHCAEEICAYVRK